jgi:hypothetical protein
MSWERWVAALLVISLATVQYGLIVITMRDLLRRPSVRGENKVVWGLVIVCLPFIGPLIYGYMGPTSFLPRSVSRQSFHWREKWPRPRDNRRR